jgi:hypothetical protein
MAGNYGIFPAGSQGYYRGTPVYGGQGAGTGQNVAGKGHFSQGVGPSQGTGWSPTILYMFILIIVEMVIFGFISRKI